MEPNKVVPPMGVMVERGPNTKTLYRLEEERNEAIKAAARELAKVLEHASGEYWTRTMPEALYATLDAYSPSMVRVVCETWLTKNPPPQGDE